jgi:predicted DNA binding CopG/RHH family protein
LFESSAPAIGAKETFREEGVKVTLALSKRSVDFFKSEAAKHRTQYQRMIRRR